MAAVSGSAHIDGGKREATAGEFARWSGALLAAAALHSAAFAYYAGMAKPPPPAPPVAGMLVELAPPPGRPAAMAETATEAPDALKEPAETAATETAPTETVVEPPPPAEALAPEPSPLPTVEPPPPAAVKKPPEKQIVAQRPPHPKPSDHRPADHRPAEKKPIKKADAPPAPGSSAASAPAAPPGDVLKVSTAALARPGDAAYLQTVFAWLEKHRQYPRRARLTNTEGTVVLRFRIDRHGKLLGWSVVRGSGSPLLDKAVEDMITAADPLPRAPADFGGPAARILEFTLPIEFRLMT